MGRGQHTYIHTYGHCDYQTRLVFENNFLEIKFCFDLSNLTSNFLLVVGSTLPPAHCTVYTSYCTGTYTIHTTHWTLHTAHHTFILHLQNSSLRTANIQNFLCWSQDLHKKKISLIGHFVCYFSNRGLSWMAKSPLVSNSVLWSSKEQ